MADDFDSVNAATRVRRVTEGLLHSTTSHIPLSNAIPETYPHSLVPMPSGGVYTYPYIPPLVIPSPLVVETEVNLTILYAQVSPV